MQKHVHNMKSMTSNSLVFLLSFMRSYGMSVEDDEFRRGWNGIGYKAFAEDMIEPRQDKYKSKFCEAFD